MAQLTTILLNDLLLEDAKGGPRFSTAVFEGSTGKEQRNINWATGRHFWQGTWAGYLSEVQSVIDLINEAKGRGFSFKWTPPGYTEMDFRLDSDEPDISYLASQSGSIVRISLSLVQVIGE
jgi:hypothetical protein